MAGRRLGWHVLCVLPLVPRFFRPPLPWVGSLTRGSSVQRLTPWDAKPSVESLMLGKYKTAKKAPVRLVAIGTRLILRTRTWAISFPAGQAAMGFGLGLRP